MKVFAFFCLLIFWAWQGNSQTKVSSKNMRDVFVDSIEFKDAKLSDVLFFLGTKAQKENIHPANFLVYDPSGLKKGDDPEITVSLNQLPFSEVVHYVALLSNNTYLADQNTAFFGSRSDLHKLSAIRRINSKGVLARAVINKLQKHKIKSIEFHQSSLNDVVDAIRYLNRAQGDVGNFVVIAGEDSSSPDSERITMALNNVSYRDLVQYTAELAGYQLDSNGNVIVFRAADSRTPPPITDSRAEFYLDTLIVKEFKVEDVGLREAANFVAAHSKQLNLIVNSESEAKVNLDLKNVTVSQIIKYINDQTSTTYRVRGSIIELFDRVAEKIPQEQNVVVNRDIF